jgi:hypothetical protein
MSSKMCGHSDRIFEAEYNISLDRKPVGHGVVIYDFLYHMGIYLCALPYPATLSTPVSNKSFETSMQ